MRVVLAGLLGLGLAGCSYGPKTVASSPTSVTVAATVYRQGVEDMASAHCAKRGLVARLNSTDTYAPSDHLAFVQSWRYECVRAP